MRCAVAVVTVGGKSRHQARQTPVVTVGGKSRHQARQTPSRAGRDRRHTEPYMHVVERLCRHKETVRYFQKERRTMKETEQARWRECMAGMHSEWAVLTQPRRRAYLQGARSGYQITAGVCQELESTKRNRQVSK